MNENKVIFFILFVFAFTITNAQSLLLKPAFLKYNIDSSVKSKILTSLDTLISQIKNNKLDTTLIDKENAGLTIDFMNAVSFIENNKKDSLLDFYKNQLINLYPISSTEYLITIAFAGNKNNEPPIIKAIINLLAKKTGSGIIFSIPLEYFTKDWKIKVVGNITYYYVDEINMERAKAFDKNNTTIANNLGLKPEKFNFYLANNYQEVLHLLGYGYYLPANGTINNGFGPIDNTVFSVLHNEDYSHDIFHHYTNKIRGEIKFNSTVEEGIAYSWGNAYYAKENGDMIEQKELVQDLKNYLQENPETDLFDLFNKDIRIFKEFPIKVTVKSTISSLLCDEVERVKGFSGIITLIKCGAGDDNFFRVLNDLVSINQSNFNAEVKKLIEQYKDK